MTIKTYILLIAFGFFMIPNAIFACNSHTSKSVSNKEISLKHEVEKGCKKHSASKSAQHNCCNENSSNDKNSKGCSGKCGHANCTVSVVSLALLSPFSNEFSFGNNFYFLNKTN